MRLKKFINEQNDDGLGITFVDIDETLFYTHATIGVVKDNKLIRSLTNAEYNAYKLKEGETLCFDEFFSGKLFYETSKPIKKMLDKISTIIEKSSVKGSKIILLTAREDMNDKEKFLNTFRKQGFPIDKTYIVRAGSKKTPSERIPDAKKRIIIEYLESGVYRRTRIYDDFLENCQAFLSIRDDVPKDIIDKIRKTYDIPENISDDKIITFEAYHVKKNGDTERIN